ncbi:MAG: phage tail protein [Anaerolineae bacterium]|nr:phage tail protein [Anaerolineae bacterium]
MPDLESERQGIQLDHVPGATYVYPGDLLVLFTRVLGSAEDDRIRVTVTVPSGTELVGTAALEVDSGRPLAVTPRVEAAEEVMQLTWDLGGCEEWSGRGEFRVTTRVLPVSGDTRLESTAFLATGDGEVIAAAVCDAAVRANGGYLKYLPEIYQYDGMMRRFLMLFESFWAPVESQIDGMACYFDPDLTPAEFLPWLGSWLDVALDERLPGVRKRQLVQSAVPLYRSRGTRNGLKRYLEAYTGGRVRIIEYRARNFELGASAQLGAGIALGLKNEPHTFKVEISLPPVEAQDHEDSQKLEAERRRRIAGIIESEKPAHTAYELRLESYER